MAVPNNPPPFAAAIVQMDPKGQPLSSYVISKEWGIWFQSALVNPVSTSVQVYPMVALTSQNTSIGVTPIPLPSLATGLYRLTYYARITTAASISSSLIVTFSWTESGIALSADGPAITGNTTTTIGSASILIMSDAASPINYNTTYVSNIAGMKYLLTIVVEAV